MTMSDPDRIDIVATDKERGKLLLVMTEHRPWTGAAEVQKQLRAKALSYAGYVMNGGLARDHPQQKPEDVIIQLVCRQAPGPKDLAFFDQIREELKQYGLAFEYQVWKPSGS